MERCSMKGCPNTTNNSQEAFYSYPTDYKLCMDWVQRTGKSKYFEDFSYQGALAFLKRKVCSAHFQLSNFCDVNNRHAGIKQHIVPLPYIKDEISSSDSSEEYMKVMETKQKKKKLTLDERLVEHQAKIRRQKNAMRAALKRSNETSEQRAERKLKDIIRLTKRRQSETDIQRRIRRYNDALRAAYRRSNETEAQRQRRRMVDIVRAARRRQSETPEQREARLKADRERAARRRLLKKKAESNSSDSSTDNSCTFSNNTLIESQLNLNDDNLVIVHHFSSVNDTINTGKDGAL